jgi:hypothetical protein
MNAKTLLIHAAVSLAVVVAYENRASLPGGRR